MRTWAIITSALFFIVAVWSGFDGDFISCGLASVAGGMFVGIATL